jgi:hypothetical protein
MVRQLYLKGLNCGINIINNIGLMAQQLSMPMVINLGGMKTYISAVLKKSLKLT